jgi:hypothetical protein
MRYRSILLIILLTIIGFILFGLGIGFLTAFIKDKFGTNFLWVGLTTVIALSGIYLKREERKAKKQETSKKYEYLEVGKLLFKNHSTDFEVFYNAHLNAGKKNIRGIESLNDFADQKKLTLMIDWRGEENDGEVEAFIGTQIDATISRTYTNDCRAKYKDDDTGNSEFIIHLFKAIDKDLKGLHKKIIFFDLGTDSYIFTVTDTTTFKEIMKHERVNFYGTEKLKI